MSENLSPRGTKILGLIIVLGLAVRLIASYLQPAFLDEGFVYYVTKSGLQGMIDVLRYDTHAPTYNLLMYPLVSLTSDIFILRLPAVLLSAGTLWLSYQLARRFFTEKASLAATAFISLSYCVWLNDAQLRSYGPLMFLLSALWIGIIDINRQGTPFIDLPWKHWRWPLYFLLAFLCSTIHVLGTLSLGVLLLLSFWLPRQSRWRLLTCFSISMLPTLAWFVWWRLHNSLHIGSADTNEYYLQFFLTPLYLLNLKSPNDVVGFIGQYIPSETCSTQIVYAYLSLNALAWIAALRGWFTIVRRHGWEGWLLCSVFALPLLAILVSCLLGLQAYTPRYGMVLTLPFILALAEGCPRRWKINMWQGALGWTAVLCLLFPFCTPLWNQYWQGVTDYIDHHAQNGDIICVYNPYAAYSFALAYDPQGVYYEISHDTYYRATLRQRDGDQRLPIIPLTLSNLHDSFLDRVRGHRVFLVLCQRFQGDSSLSWLGERFSIIDGARFPSLTYWADVEVCMLKLDD